MLSYIDGTLQIHCQPNKRNSFANLFLLSFSPKELLILAMRDCNANAILKIFETSNKLFVFKSILSCKVLLFLAGNAGACELREVFRTNFATDIAMRQHIHVLEKTGFVTVKVNKEHRRAKQIALTEKGYALLRGFEQETQLAIDGWKRVRKRTG